MYKVLHGGTSTLKLLYEGKSKRVYVKDDELLVLEFKDAVTALNGLKKDVVPGKGIINAQVSAYLFEVLEKNGIATHYVDYDGKRCITAKRLDMIPLEVIVRNYAYGSLLKRMPCLQKLRLLEPPIIEFHYKSDELGDPLVLEDDIIHAGLLSKRELEEIKEVSLKVNNVLKDLFSKAGLKLIDFKLEFGRDKNGQLVLGDEITGDTIRVIDEMGRHLDKEVYRRGGSTSDLLNAYIELAKRLGLEVVF